MIHGENQETPQTAMFFSPDLFVQAPGSWLNYNRYGYCYGNPFKYTDPDGEFILTAIVVGAMVGAFFGGMQADRAGENYWGGFLKGAFVGALSGVVGAGVGYAVAQSLTSATTFGCMVLNGAITGGIGGATGGFIGSATNSWLNGASFGEGLLSGLKGAAIGGVTGGALGTINILANKSLFDEMSKLGSDLLAYEYAVDVRTGTTTQIGSVTGPDSHIYNTGVWSDAGTAFELFNSYNVAGGNTINAFRFWESMSSTISAYSIPAASMTGYFLERPGPSSVVPNQNLRIPEGSYNFIPNNNRFPDCYMLGNDCVSFSRGITIHPGNTPNHTNGCLLPGSSWKSDYVGNSRNTTDLINSYIKRIGYKNIKFNIFDIK
jgi:hypothetical protein